MNWRKIACRLCGNPDLVEPGRTVCADCKRYIDRRAYGLTSFGLSWAYGRCVAETELRQDHPAENRELAL